MERPKDLDKWHVVAFAPDYAADTPLSLADGMWRPEDVNLSPDLGRRLVAWSDYWERRIDSSGWVEADDHWFQQELRDLAYEVAQELGVEFAVLTHDAVFRSIDPPTRPEAAAVLQASAAQWAEIHSAKQRGVQFGWRA